MKEYGVQIIVGAVGVIVSGGLGLLGFALIRFVKRFARVPDLLDLLLKVNEAQTETIGVVVDASLKFSSGMRHVAFALKKIGCNGDTDAALQDADDAENGINAHRTKRMKEAMKMEAVG